MVKLNVMIPEADKAELERIAQEEERNISWVTRKAIQEYIKNHKEEEE